MSIQGGPHRPLDIPSARPLRLARSVRVGSWAFGVCGFAWALSAGCHHKPPSITKSGPSAAASAGSALDSDARRDFNRNIAAYISLRERLARTMADTAGLKGTDDASSVLRALIANARAKAKPGDVFEPAMQISIRRIVRREVEGAGGANIRASLMDENPMGVAIRINGGYPNSLPLSTMTAALLAALPQLPDGLEFHFVGSRMVLLDTRARMIVDFVENVLK